VAAAFNYTQIEVAENQLRCCQLCVGVRLVSLNNAGFCDQIDAEQASFLARGFYCKASQQRQQ
jgi:hypothetical protein